MPKKTSSLNGGAASAKTRKKTTAKAGAAKKARKGRKSLQEQALEATMLAWQETYAKRDKMLIDYRKD
jgi:hypothetical protein